MYFFYVRTINDKKNSNTLMLTIILIFKIYIFNKYIKNIELCYIILYNFES